MSFVPASKSSTGTMSTEASSNIASAASYDAPPNFPRITFHQYMCFLERLADSLIADSGIEGSERQTSRSWWAYTAARPSHCQLDDMPGYYTDLGVFSNKVPSDEETQALIMLLSIYSFELVAVLPFAFLTTSTGSHQGYTSGAESSSVPVKLTGRFSKKELTPSLLSL